MSQTFDFAINNGQALVHEKGGLKRLDVSIGVNGGKIAQISTTPLAAEKTVDAKNLMVLPGVIDSQVHFRDPGLTHKEDFGTGTKSAALGGVTCVFDMPNTKPSVTTAELYNEKLNTISHKAWVNFGVFIGASPDNFAKLAVLERMPGCAGVKIFMGSSTGTLLVPDDATLESVLRYGERRAIVHSEDEARLIERKPLAIQAASPTFHNHWRDVETAVKSTSRLLRLARRTGRKVHVLHVTTGEEMELLREHKAASGKDSVTVEVLPQHLTLAAPECYERLGTKAQMNPPIREAHHRDALWRAIADGTVDVLGSDHAPHTLAEKAEKYPASPSGMPGVQTILPLMLNHVNDGKLSLERLVGLMCENPRRVFGCLTKGRIEVGMDADFTIIDMNRSETITNSAMATKSGWTPFDGMRVKGWPVATIVGGRAVMREGEVIGMPMGQMVHFTAL